MTVPAIGRRHDNICQIRLINYSATRVFAATVWMYSFYHSFIYSFHFCTCFASSALYQQRDRSRENLCTFKHRNVVICAYFLFCLFFTSLSLSPSRSLSRSLVAGIWISSNSIWSNCWFYTHARCLHYFTQTQLLETRQKKSEQLFYRLRVFCVHSFRLNEICDSWR